MIVNILKDIYLYNIFYLNSIKKKMNKIFLSLFYLNLIIRLILL